jgi:hypothetical protein
MILFPDQFNGKNDQAQYKDQEADPVNAMHVTDPFALWPGRVFFFEEEIFSYLIPDTHDLKSKVKNQN